MRLRVCWLVSVAAAERRRNAAVGQGKLGYSADIDLMLFSEALDWLRSPALLLLSA